MNDYNLKIVSSLLGHVFSIITIDVYTDKTKLAIDCLEELEQFIKSVISKQKNNQKITRIFTRIYPQILHILEA